MVEKKIALGLFVKNKGDKNKHEPVRQGPVHRCGPVTVAVARSLSRFSEKNAKISTKK